MNAELLSAGEICFISRKTYRAALGALSQTAGATRSERWIFAQRDTGMIRFASYA